MTRNKLYTLLMVLSLSGYSWLAFHIYSEKQNSTTGQVCIFKYTTNLPCPSCGTTRSVLEILEGNFLRAFYINPLGFVLFLGLLILPIWVTKDVLQKKRSLLRFYLQFEKLIIREPIAISLIIIILLNWGWNIYKDL
jgi:hypothetical protein